MTISQYCQNLRLVIDGLAQQRQILTLAMAMDGLAMVSKRSREQGLTVDSQPGAFVEYSDRPMLTFNFRNQLLNSQGREYVDKHPLGTWADFKKAQGKPVDHVTADYTGAFWSSLGIINQQNEAEGYRVQIGSTNPRVQAYIGELYDRYGNFIVPHPDEQRALLVDLANKFNQYLFSHL